MKPLLLFLLVNGLAVGEVPTAADKVCPLKVGQAVPGVALRTLNGKPVKLSQAVKSRPSVIVFYRGGWCPYCNMHLSALAKSEKKLLKLGYQILAISPDRPEELKKSKGKHKMNYTLLSDSSMEAAKKFGLAFRVGDALLKKYKGYGIDLEASSGQKHHLLPVPAVFLVDTEGIIQFQYVNPDYKIRLNGDVLMAAAKALLPRN